MKEIKVSVIVPVYNSAPFLSKCIESLLFQTLQDIEIILINDASTDNSLDILLKYKAMYPEKIVVIHSEINQRQGGARNLGIEIAKGEYIGFVDSDDWIEKEMYFELYQEAIKQNSDICYAKVQQIDEKGNISEDNVNYFLPIGNVTEKERKEMLICHITRIVRNIYKRSLLIENNIRFPVHLQYEDIIFDPLVLLYAKDIAAVNKTFYNYYIHSNSTTHKIDEQKYKDRLNVAQLLVEEFKKRNYYEKYKDEIDYLYFRKGFIHTALKYITNAQIIKTDVISEIVSSLLYVVPQHQNNPYYRQKISFMVIDKIIRSNSIILWKLLKIVIKRFLKTI